jgi:hypothetical protein
MRISRYNIFLFFAIFFATTGIWFFYDWSIEKVNTTLCFLNFLPAMIFVLICIFEKNYKQNKLIQYAINTIVFLSIILFLLFMYIMNLLIPVHYGLKSPRKYPYIVANNWSDYLVRHFPKKIPAAAKNIKFFYRAGFMQGGSAIQLRYSTSPEKINKLYNRFSKKKTKSYWGGNKYTHVNQGNGRPTTSFITGDTIDKKFSKDY